MAWFGSLTGFNEALTDQVRERLRVEGNILTSLVSGSTYIFGTLEFPSLSQLPYSIFLATIGGVEPSGIRGSGLDVMERTLNIWMWRS